MLPPRKEETLKDYKLRVLRVLDWLDAHPDASPSLAELASVAAFSPFHFHHVFRGLSGVAPMEHLRRLRLERAWQRLQDGGASVANVALDSGYGSEEGFIRAFRKVFGITPGAARGLEPKLLDPAELKLRVLNFSFRLGESLPHGVDEMAAFEVIGMGVDCPDFDNSGIGPLWWRFIERLDELGSTGRIVGISYPRENGYYYVAGAEVPAGTELPDGLQHAHVPGGNYFRSQYHDLATRMGTAFSPIFSELLPAAGLTPATEPICIEDYPPDFHDEDAGTFRLDLYVQLDE
ncbi:MAG: AraC family transcriptional regulator [bacterium]